MKKVKIIVLAVLILALLITGIILFVIKKEKPSNNTEDTKEVVSYYDVEF